MCKLTVISQKKDICHSLRIPAELLAESRSYADEVSVKAVHSSNIHQTAGSSSLCRRGRSRSSCKKRVCCTFLFKF